MRNVNGKKGFTLVELLIALTLLSIAAPLVAGIFYQGVRANGKVRLMLDKRRPVDKIFWAMEKDLKNAVFLSSSPFEGGSHRLSFSSLGNGLNRVEYSLNERSVLRVEESLASESQNSEGRVHQTLLGEETNIFELEYAYRDAKGRVLFLPHWQGREGIPEALKITVALEGQDPHPKSLVIFLPQGNAGVIGS